MRVDPSLNAIALFAGGGGLELGVHLARRDLRVVAYVEREAYAVEVLASRMEAQDLAAAPIWSDCATFDGRAWCGCVDLILGGFPCQDVSNAGKRAGLDGERSGMWRHFARIIDEIQPRLVFIENVAALRGRGLDRVLADLASLGFDAEWSTVRASDVGAPHGRDRIFILGRSVEHAAQLAQREQEHAALSLARGVTRPFVGGGCDDVGSAHVTRLERWSSGDSECAGERVAGAAGLVMADAQQQQQLRHESRRRGGTGRAGEGEPRDACEALADAESVGGPEGRPEFEGRLRNASSGVGSVPLADTDGGRQRRERSARLFHDLGQALGRDADGRGGAFTVWPAGRDAPREHFRPDLEPAVCRTSDGLADRVERLRLLGNGVVPLQAAYAWWQLSERLGI